MMSPAFRNLLATTSLCAVLPASAVNLVTNGNFAGLTGWTTAQATGATTGVCGYNADSTPGTETETGTAGFAPVSTPTTVALGGASVTGVGYNSCVLYQDIAIPVGALTATISADVGAKVTGAQSASNRVTDIGIYSTAAVPAFQTVPLGTTAARIRVVGENGTTLVPRSTTPASFNVSAFAGTTVRFAIIHAVQSTGGGSGAAPADGASVTGITNVVFDVTVDTPPPTVSPDSYSTTANTALSVAAPGVLGNDSVSGGATMTAAIATTPANGTAAVAADGSFTYVPNSGFTGTDSFTYTATANGATSAPATVTVAVNAAVPMAPTAIPTLSEWGLILASVSLGGLGFAMLRRRKDRV